LVPFRDWHTMPFRPQTHQAFFWFCKFKTALKDVVTEDSRAAGILLYLWGFRDGICVRLFWISCSSDNFPQRYWWGYEYR
jgi:hypothetical protein